LNINESKDEYMSYDYSNSELEIFVLLFEQDSFLQSFALIRISPLSPFYHIFSTTNDYLQNLTIYLEDVSDLTRLLNNHP